ncbi:hypothetical protein GEV33_013250 [Tenebrio molitor]|uniref:Uncharacterized protein n=1 Tax=Tenebrio molitor TaxID=7067 RepID=A0A8J6L6M5_TENMO|nr:hypothetical protein GEV33_013250 [Tenebrio molitor]
MKTTETEIGLASVPAMAIGSSTEVLVSIVENQAGLRRNSFMFNNNQKSPDCDMGKSPSTEITSSSVQSTPLVEGHLLEAICDGANRPEMAQQNTNGWSHTEGNLQNQNQGTDQPVQVDLRVHKAAEVPNVHAPATPKDSLQNDDFWTVRELLWGILIIVISITVLLLVGWALAFKIPHARPK